MSLVYKPTNLSTRLKQRESVMWEPLPIISSVNSVRDGNVIAKLFISHMFMLWTVPLFNSGLLHTLAL